MTRFYSCQKTDKNFKEFNIWSWGMLLKIRDVCMDFETVFQGPKLGLCLP